MSETAIIPKVPPLEPKVTDKSDVAGKSVPPEADPPTPPAGTLGKVDSTGIPSEPVEDQPPAIEVLPLTEGESTPSEKSVITSTSTIPVPEGTAGIETANDSITYLQGATYASFILIFGLAGFAAVVVFRKALKTTVTRFSIGAKALSLAYLILAFFGSFGTYIYSRFLNGGETSFPVFIPVLSWVFAGPAIAMVLNSLLTRKDEPQANKVFFDVFTYLVIFGFTTASQLHLFEAKESLVFSSLGVVFFLFPIIRFSTSFKVSKVVHPELREIFIQILVRSLLILPMFLPALALINECELIGNDFALLLFNSVTLTFVLMTGLLMVISIDYITQGISADQLVAQDLNMPTKSSGSQSNKPEPPPAPPSQSAGLDSPNILRVQKNQEKVGPVSDKPKVSLKQPSKSAEPDSPVLPNSQKSQVPAGSAPTKPVEKETKPPVDQPVSDTTKSSLSPTKSFIPFEESSEVDEFDVKDDSTVIDFDSVKSSAEESDKNSSSSQKTKFGSPGSKPKSSGQPQKPKPPKAPNSQNTSKSIDSKSHIKPPEKPKKRF